MLRVGKQRILPYPSSIRVSKQRLLVYCIPLALLALLVAKLWNGLEHSYAPLYMYGVLVTLVIFTTFVVTYKKYKDPALADLELPEHLKQKPLVSCMVAVRNEEGLIEQCILSIVNQTYDRKEIIFVNDASSDGTAEILDRYAGDQNLITVIHLKSNVGKKRALAVAMSRAKGEIYAFSDSDSIIAPDAISKAVDAFNSDPLIGAISGHCRALNGDKNLLTKIQDSWYEGQFSVRKAAESVFGAVTCVSGPLAIYRKEAIYNSIPAWENDTFLGQQFTFATDRTLTGFVLGSKSLVTKNQAKYADSPFVKGTDFPPRDWKVVYCKSVKAMTAVPDTFRKLVRQQIRWKKSFIRNIFFTGRFYWRKPLIPAMLYYLHILIVLAGPFVAFRHLVYLPLRGDIFSAFIYLGGIVLVGSMFALAFQVEDKGSNKWVYRPLMSLMSTLILSWLIFYSAATIKNMKWER